MKRTVRYFWIGLGTLTILTPLGILSQKTAWGEWAGEEFTSLIGFIPEKLKQTEHIWRAPFPHYSILGPGGPVEYLASAVIGCAVAASAAIIIGRLLR